jgi:hypothetical protein
VIPGVWAVEEALLDAASSDELTGKVTGVVSGVGKTTGITS